jgi:hypothetical protein
MAQPTIIERAWGASSTTVVIGAGASLSTKQVRHVAIARLEGRCRVIAINDAIYPAWFADHLHACDSKWFFWHAQRIQHFTGIKTTLDETLPDGFGAGLLKNTGEDGFDPEPGCVRSGSNGGYQGIHIAMQAGATKILLLGFDMHRRHFFGDHPDRIKCDHATVMVPHFSTLLEPAKDRGVEIVNCTPDSALTCFRMSDIEQEI